MSFRKWGLQYRRETGGDSQNSSERGSWDNSAAHCAGVNHSTLDQAKNLWERVAQEETMDRYTWVTGGIFKLIMKR